MPTMSHNGVKLAYDGRGKGRPAFVFIHGWTCDRSFFAPQVKHFARRHRVVSLDLRGHGQSDKPQGPYPISAYVGDIAFLIGTLRLGKVAAIVMVDPAPLVWPPELNTGVDAIVAAIDAGNQEPRRQFIADALFMKTSDKTLTKRVLKTMMASPSHVAADAMKGILAFDGPAIAARCKVPALHLAATPPLNPPHLMTQWLPNVVNGWTVGAGHFNMMEVPDQVNSMIGAFLRHYV
jgi:pimeloyl-ACP methyl ester carboxylesterase